MCGSLFCCRMPAGLFAGRFSAERRDFIGGHADLQQIVFRGFSRIICCLVSDFEGCGQIPDDDLAEVGKFGISQFGIVCFLIRAGQQSRCRPVWYNRPFLSFQ